MCCTTCSTRITEINATKTGNASAHAKRLWPVSVRERISGTRTSTPPEIVPAVPHSLPPLPSEKRCQPSQRYRVQGEVPRRAAFHSTVRPPRSLASRNNPGCRSGIGSRRWPPHEPKPSLQPALETCSLCTPALPHHGKEPELREGDAVCRTFQNPVPTERRTAHVPRGWSASHVPLSPPPPFPQNELPCTLLTRAAVLRLQIVGGSVADPHPCVGGRLCRLLLVVTPQHSSLLPRLAGAGGGGQLVSLHTTLQTFSDPRMHWRTAACMDRAALRLRNALRVPDVDIRGGAHS